MKWGRACLGIVLGAALTAVALNMFLIPNRIAAGGTSGLATVIHHLAGLPVGMTTMAFDIPLLLLSIKMLGGRFGVNTLFAGAVMAVTIDLTAPYVPVLTTDLLLSSLYGGVVCGIGMGLVFRFGGCTAGSDLVAAMLNKVFGISVGQALLSVDFFIIVVAGIAFQSPELSLYALICLFVTTQVIDLVQQGPSSAKAFFIMSAYSQEVSAAIMHELERGVTFLAGRGGYTSTEQEVIFCVVSNREVNKVKDLISTIDRNAFVIVADAHEVLGEGFNPHKLVNK